MGISKLKLQARRKSLSIFLEGGNSNVHAVRVGRVAGLDNAVTAHIPFWVLRSRGVSNPSVLYSNGMLMSVFNDVYYSKASTGRTGYRSLVGRDDPGVTIWNEHNQESSKSYCGENPGVSNHPNVVNAVYMSGHVKANTLNATSQAYAIYDLAAFCDDFN